MTRRRETGREEERRDGKKRDPGNEVGHQVEVQESVDRIAKQFFPPNLTPGVN